jgi:linearmycin/streptolysin S transport system permease protein
VRARGELGKALAIGRIALIRQLRDRRDLFFLVVLPTLIIFAIGLQFGSSARARLGVVAPPNDAAAAILVSALAADPGQFDVQPVADEATLRDRVERGTLEAGIVIPAGLDASLTGSGTAKISYLATNSPLALGLRAPVDAAVARLAAIGTAARVAVAEGAGDGGRARAAAASLAPTVPGVMVDVTTVGESGPFTGFSTFSLGASTQLIMFMFLTSLTAATAVVVSRQLGVSRRMLATPTGPWTIVIGESLGRYAIALLQAAYIVAISSLVFGVSWGDPIAAGAIVAVFGLVAAGAGMLVGAVARNPSQAGSFAVFVGLALGALGGCMVPYQVMPSSMQAIARLIPHSWAVLGLQTLISGGSGLASVAPNLGVLAVYAVVLLGLAGWRYRAAITR